MLICTLETTGRLATWVAAALVGLEAWQRLGDAWRPADSGWRSVKATPQKELSVALTVRDMPTMEAIAAAIGHPECDGQAVKSYLYMLTRDPPSYAGPIMDAKGNKIRLNPPLRHQTPPTPQHTPIE